MTYVPPGAASYFWLLVSIAEAGAGGGAGGGREIGETDTGDGAVSLTLLPGVYHTRAPALAALVH